MKLLATLLVAIAGIWTSGCATDSPAAEDVQEHLQRGASGQGELGPLDRGNDPFVHSREGDPNLAHP